MSDWHPEDFKQAGDTDDGPSLQAAIDAALNPALNQGGGWGRVVLGPREYVTSQTLHLGSCRLTIEGAGFESNLPGFFAPAKNFWSSAASGGSGGVKGSAIFVNAGVPA